MKNKEYYKGYDAGFWEGYDFGRGVTDNINGFRMVKPTKEAWAVIKKAMVEIEKDGAK